MTLTQTVIPRRVRVADEDDAPVAVPVLASGAGRRERRWSIWYGNASLG